MWLHSRQLSSLSYHLNRPGRCPYLVCQEAAGGFVAGCGL